MKKHKEPMSNETIILYLQDMMKSAGWKIVEQIFKDNIILIEKQILEKMNAETGESISEKEVDKLRIKREYFLQIIDTPKGYIEMLENPESTPEEFDPFFKTIKDIEKARQNERDK